MVIHRNTNYIKFVSARHTTACNAGEVLEAWKDDCNNWHIWNPKEGKRYSAFVGTIRAIAGECLEQDRSVLQQFRKRGNLKTNNTDVRMVETNKKGASTMSKNSEAVKKYYSENCTEFKIRQFKEEAQTVKDYAAAHGCSVQALFLAAVADYMAQDKTPGEVKRGRKKVKEDNTT